jgi:membrane-bound lytic murein transglycosylase B
MRWAVLLLLVGLTAGCTGDDPGAAPTSAPTTPPPSSTSPSPLVPTDEAGHVARTVVALVRADRSPGSAAAARLQQVAYRTWSDHPGWDRDVLKALPAELRPLARDNVAARRALRSIYPSSAGALPHELPAWRIDPPDPLTELVADYHLAQRRTGVDWATLAAINFVETDFGRITGTSDAGAQGPMQFIPATWAAYGAGGDIRDPHDAILGAGRLLAANGFADHPQEALHHYNDSDGYVRAVMLLAGIIREHPQELTLYHAWQIYFLTSRGPILLPEGYDEARPVPVGRWLRTHPQGG